VIGDATGRIQIYNTSQCQPLVKSFQAHANLITCIKKSPWSSYIATASIDFTAKIWDLNWNLTRTYTNHTNHVRTLEWINADTIATGSADSFIKIWSISTGVTNRSIFVPTWVWSLQLLSNGFHLAAGLPSTTLIYTICIYDINTGNIVSTLYGHTDKVVDFSLINSNLLASSSSDLTIRIWDLTTLTLKFNMTGHSLFVWGLKLLSSDVLASGSADATIKLWNVTSGQVIRTLAGHTGGVRWGLDVLNANEQTIVSGSSGYFSLKIWRWTTGECLNTINTNTSIQTLIVLNPTAATIESNIYMCNFKFL
jgi:WD40 repeat protein